MRPWLEEDAPALFKYASDPEVGPRAGWPPHRSLDESREVIRTVFSGEGMWAVVLKETGEFIGDCGIALQNIDGEILPEIGYHIHKKYWRRGFAKEAARAVRDWGFRNTDYDTFYSYMKYTNVGSWSTALANGMKKVKEYPDPKNTISYAFAITRDEWEKLQQATDN